MHWSVPKAVQSVMNSINAGASTVQPGLKLGKAAHDHLHDYYMTTFQAMHASGANWNTDQLVVLPLAGLLGSYAAGDEIAGSFPPLPSEISKDSAVKAARVVSISGWCQKGGKVVFGGYCKPPIGYTNTKVAEAALTPFLRVALKILQGPPKSAAKRGAKKSEAKTSAAKKSAARKGGTKTAAAKRTAAKRKAAAPKRGTRTGAPKRSSRRRR